MTLSDAIRDALKKLGLETTGPDVRDLIAKKHPSLKDKLDTPTFSTTFSTLRKKEKQAAGTDSEEAPSKQPTAAITAPKPVKKTAPAGSEEITPEEKAIVQLREAYKHLVALVGQEVAHSISTHMSGKK
jgi:hypothetical protein